MNLDLIGRSMLKLWQDDIHVSLSAGDDEFWCILNRFGRVIMEKKVPYI